MSARQTPLQRVDPAGQAQRPAVHWAPPEHTVPQAPQWLALVCVLTHAPPQLVSPPAQLQVPPEQNDPPKHPTLHAPQLRGSIWVFVHVPLHCTVPVLHTDWQVPSTQTCALVQLRPHAPQFTGSLARLVHPLVQGTCVPVHPQTPITHDCPPGHVRPHAPQLVALVLVLTQAPLHCVRPKPVGHWQRPMKHNCPVPQVVPQAPQLVVLLLVSTQGPLQLVCPRTQLVRQRPKVHTWPAVQVVPHAPQLVVEDWVPTQTPLHSTCAGVPPPGPPVAAAQPPMPLRKVRPTASGTPAPPRTCGPWTMVAHPPSPRGAARGRGGPGGDRRRGGAGLREREEWWVGGRVYTQGALQWVCPAAPTHDRAWQGLARVQARPQAPQLAASVRVSAQAAAHAT